MANNNLKINPAVDQVIKPIVFNMTKVYLTQKTNPMMTPDSEDKAIKELKKECIHIVYDGNSNDYRPCVNKNEKGELVCDVCGRKIWAEFNEEGIKILTDAISVINGVLFVVLLNGLKSEPIQALISQKKLLPGTITLLKSLNNYINQENKSAKDGFHNVGKAYGSASGLKGITEMIQ